MFPQWKDTVTGLLKQFIRHLAVVYGFLDHDSIFGRDILVFLRISGYFSVESKGFDYRQGEKPFQLLQ